MSESKAGCPWPCYDFLQAATSSHLMTFGLLPGPLLPPSVSSSAEKRPVPTAHSSSDRFPGPRHLQRSSRCMDSQSLQ